LRGLFGDVGGPLDRQELGLNSPSEEASPSVATDVVKPVRAVVFSPGGEADNPGQAAQAIDGNPATAWTTDTYSDPVPFPSFKNGVGLMLQLPQPTTLASVSIDLNSTGTSIQIRSSDSATPSSLDDTTALSSPTPMKTGSNTITLDGASPTSYVLVWITTLGTVDGRSESSLSDITLKATS
jgi:putative peptidoglycan lipid II flippase